MKFIKKTTFYLLSSITITAMLSACMPENKYADFALPIPTLTQSSTILEYEVGIPASTERFNDSRPNIIVIMTDDQPYHTVHYMPAVKNILMKDGIVFENGFATTPLCCPSRASILTGEYAHNHEVFTNRMPLGGAEKFDDSNTVAIWLQNAGYQTAYFGKYMNDYENLQPLGYVPAGWDEWNVFLSKNLDTAEDAGNLQFYFNFSMSHNGSVIDYPRSLENFSADVITNQALQFINQSRDVPFMMFVSYYNPHSPYVTAPRHKETFRSGTGWDWIQYRPPNFNEENIKDKPAYLEELSPLSDEEIDTAHKQILRSLLSVDDGVATILDMLTQTNLKENTIIIFTSDNGLTLGDHRFGATKNCAYEACIKIPFIVYAPQYYQPRTDFNLVANIDITPTLANWAGVSFPESVDGLSLANLLENSESAWRTEILLEHWQAEEGVGAIIPDFYSIRTNEWKYTEYVTGEVELYNLIQDPYELVNIAGEYEYQDIQIELAKKLQALKQE